MRWQLHRQVTDLFSDPHPIRNTAYFFAKLPANFFRDVSATHTYLKVYGWNRWFYKQYIVVRENKTWSLIQQSRTHRHAVSPNPYQAGRRRSWARVDIPWGFYHGAPSNKRCAYVHYSGKCQGWSRTHTIVHKRGLAFSLILNRMSNIKLFSCAVWRN